MDCKLLKDRKYICCVHTSERGLLVQCRLFFHNNKDWAALTLKLYLLVVVIEGREDGFVVQGDWWRLWWHLESTTTLAAQGRLGSQKLDFIAIRAENRI